MSQSYAKSPAAERKFTTREMVLVGMFAAVLAVISQISLPMPTGVPITIGSEICDSTCRSSTWFQTWNYSNIGLRFVRSHRSSDLCQLFRWNQQHCRSYRRIHLGMADHDLALWNPSENREQDKEPCNLNRICTDRTSDR